MIADSTGKINHEKIMFGRYMLPDSSEHPCRISHLTIDGAVFISEHVPPPGQLIVSYVEILGRIEALTGEPLGDGFQVSFSLSGNRRSRIEEKLRNLEKKLLNSLERIPAKTEAREAGSLLTFPDGREYPCKVLDISTTGADIMLDVLPDIGCKVMLGKMKGQVARFLEWGVAIEFTASNGRKEFP